MGLDIYLSTYNKVLTQEDMTEFEEYVDVKYMVDNMKKYIKEVDNAGGAMPYSVIRFADKINEFNKIKSGEDVHGGPMDGYIYNCINSETPKLSDFETKEELLALYAKDSTEAYNSGVEAIAEAERIWLELGHADKYKDIKETDVGYFRKHSNLQGYMSSLYESRVKDANEFNGQYLVLTKEDAEEILRKAELETGNGNEFESASGFFWGKSNKEDWKETVSMFKKILQKVDFDKETLVYSCSY